MGLTDRNLDATSRQLLDQIDEMKRLELDKRYEPRSTDEFHDLAGKVEERAKEIFELAHHERVGADEDSPIAAEREEQFPGDWTDGGRHEST